MALKQLSRTIDGITTELVIQDYADTTLVIVTQLGKIGCLIQASLPATTPLSRPSGPITNWIHELPQPSPAIQLTNILGQAPSHHLQTLHSVYASQIATLVWMAEAGMESMASRRNIVLGIALKPIEATNAMLDRSTFLEVMSMVLQLLDSSGDSP